MTTSLGIFLVFNMTAAQTRGFEFDDRARDVHGFAETGVDVDDAGERRNLRDRSARGGDFGLRGQADIGNTEIIRENGAGNVHAIEGDLLDEHGDERRERAGKTEE